MDGQSSVPETVDLDKLREYAEQWNKTKPSVTSGYVAPYKPYPTNPCPSCGHCPTCGRSNGWIYPTGPQWTWTSQVSAGNPGLTPFYAGAASANGF